MILKMLYIHKFYLKMKIFANLPFKFMRKIVLFSFWYYIDNIYIYIYYIFIVPIIYENTIMKYITFY